jgi:hypothetical protein
MILISKLLLLLLILALEKSNILPSTLIGKLWLGIAKMVSFQKNMWVECILVLRLNMLIFMNQLKLLREPFNGLKRSKP